jgi:hypothetical protein
MRVVITESSNCPLARIEITVSYLGYKKSTIPNIQLTSAKEMVTNIELEPAVQEMKEVEVTGGKRKGEAINEMTTLSARAFTVDDAARYAEVETTLRGWHQILPVYRVQMIREMIL